MNDELNLVLMYLYEIKRSDKCDLNKDTLDEMIAKVKSGSLLTIEQIELIDKYKDITPFIFRGHPLLLNSMKKKIKKRRQLEEESNNMSKLMVIKTYIMACTLRKDLSKEIIDEFEKTIELIEKESVISARQLKIVINQLKEDLNASYKFNIEILDDVKMLVKIRKISKDLLNDLENIFIFGGDK